ncbi:unnamed protein product [Discosporangium mesarthrocarpum]
MYQIANIYITVTAGSISEALSEIIENPSAVISILGDTFPSVAVYFFNLVVVKTLAGLPMELIRGWPLLRILWVQKCTNQATRTGRELREGAFEEPELKYGWVYPTLLLVLVICLVYAVISPFIMPVGALFFMVAYLVYKYQVLYVYMPQYESGGVFWLRVYHRVLVGLGAAQLTVIGYVTLRGGYTQAALMVPLPFMVYFYGRRNYFRYLRPMERLSLETASRIDRGTAVTPDSPKPGVRHGKDEGASGAGQQRPVTDDFNPLVYAQPALTAGRAVLGEGRFSPQFHERSIFNSLGLSREAGGSLGAPLLRQARSNGTQEEGTSVSRTSYNTPTDV